MKRAAVVFLALLAWAPAQTTRPVAAARVIAMDHAEAAGGVTAWITATPSDERALLVARGGAIATRLRGRPLRDVLIDSSGKTALLLVEQGIRFSLERIDLEGDVAPRVVLADLAMTTPLLGRFGDETILLTETDVRSVAPDGAVKTAFSRDDPTITAVVRGPRGAWATVHAGDVEELDATGALTTDLGPGAWPQFLGDGALAFVRSGADPDALHPKKSDLMIFMGTDLPEEPELRVAGDLTRLRAVGHRALLFQHVNPRGQARFWLFHPATSVVRAIEPADLGALRAATGDPASRRVQVADESPIFGEKVAAKAEPETDTSGFFRIDENGSEVRTDYESSGWDDLRHPEEARRHALLLDRFLEGLQWPLRREPGYEPLIASDDLPYRGASTIPHLGLDVGARLLHVATGSVAFHAPAAPVYPLWRGGTIGVDQIATLRHGETSRGSERCRLLQEVELREGAYVLRVHVSFDHVRPYNPGAEEWTPNDGSEAIGGLEPFSDISPDGSWNTGDPVLAAHDIAKGNHVHVGIGGIFHSFNTSVEAGTRKLRWYRERLIPALKKAPGPR